MSSADLTAQTNTSSPATAGTLISSNATAIVLHLRGGDRLTGIIVSESPTQIIVSNQWANSIRVPIGEILRREPVVAKQAEQKAPPPAVSSLTNSAVRPGTAAVSGPLRASKPQSPHHWAGEAQVGADVAFGERQRQLYSGRFKVTYGYQQLRNVFDYTFAYGKTDGILSDKRMAGFSKTDFELGKKSYVYNLGGAGFDQIRKIDLRYEVGPGMGLHTVKLTNYFLNTEFGINYQAQYQSDDTKTESFFFRLAESSTWAINGHLSLDEKFEFFPRVDEWDTYRFRLESNVRLALVSNLSFVITVLDQFDTQPALTVTRNDLQLRSSISVKF